MTKTDTALSVGTLSQIPLRQTASRTLNDLDREAQKQQSTLSWILGTGELRVAELPGERIRVTFNASHFKRLDLFWEWADSFVSELERQGFKQQTGTPQWLAAQIPQESTAQVGEVFEMFYHVRMTPKPDRSPVVKLDLSKRQLRSQFLTPYENGAPIIVAGRTINADGIEEIRISRTRESSSAIRRMVEAEQVTQPASYIPVEWYIAEKGEDVTDELIKGPPGYGEKPSSRMESEVKDSTEVSALRAVILTALRTEFKAVKGHLINIEQKRHRGTVYEQGDFVSSETQKWKVLIAEIGAGNPTAAAEAERAIRYYDPNVALFVGIAGGLKIKEVRIGDVIAATKVYGYESGSADARTFKARPDVMMSSYALEQLAKAEARKDDWMGRIKGKAPKRRPRVLVGPIAAGAKVVKSRRAEVAKFISTHYNDALAVEMEGIGFLAAVHLNEKVKAIVIRGISDLLDDKDKVDKAGSQEIAARYASAFAFQVLAEVDITQDI